jgi:hypothetical protein
MVSLAVALSALPGTPAISQVGSVAAAISAQPIRYLETPAGQKPRVVITADPELDDANSLIRYLLYSADFRTEGLVYASSQFHWKGDGKGTRWFVPGREYRRFGLELCPCTSWRWDPQERFIDRAVDAYAAAWPNLHQHDPAYPTPDALRSVIRWGNVQFDGEMDHDTAGSDLIKRLLLDAEDSPVYLHAWGGQSTIARALKSIEEQYGQTPEWPAIRARVIAKAVIHPSGDQDDTYARYIQPFWPEIRYRKQEGAIPLSYGAQSMVSESDAAYFSRDWTAAHISSKGPVGALYRVWGDGRQMVAGDRFDYFGIAGKTADQLKADGYVVWSPLQPQGSFLGEGDTPTFLNLVANGLDGYRDSSFGGWGGHAAATLPPLFSAGFAALEASASGQAARRTPARMATHPFLAAAQNDLAARLDWATTPGHSDANHPPRIAAKGPTTIEARPGETVNLRLSASDPDGDKVSVRWWRWDEADSYAGTAPPSRPEGLRSGIVVPQDAPAGSDIQLVAQATDSGTPPLTRYVRFVVRVIPAH